MQQTAAKATWEKLVRLEPHLADLRSLARMVKDPGGKRGFCANEHWYRRFKPKLLWIVGWERHDGPEALRTKEAYDLAYKLIYNELPDCRNCECL